MTELETRKVAFADASIALEIAQLRFNETKNKLIAELNKPQAPTTPTPPPTPAKIKKPEVA